MLHYDSLCGLYLSKEERKGGGGQRKGKEEKVWLPGEIKEFRKKPGRRYLSGAALLLQGVKERRGSRVT